MIPSSIAGVVQSDANDRNDYMETRLKAIPIQGSFKSFFFFQEFPDQRSVTLTGQRLDIIILVASGT